MKKKILVLLSLLIISMVLNSVSAKSVSSPDLAEAISLYKKGDYSQCFVKLESILGNDPANALAYYYKAMVATHLGRKDEAVSNYEKVLVLNPQNNNLRRYAEKGKRCLLTPDKCDESVFIKSDVDEFIQNNKGNFFSEMVENEFERLKIENLMREMNRNNNIDPAEFKEYKDFSANPTNDEIVAALRTLQKAGLGNVFNQNTTDFSMLTGNNQQNSMLNMFGSSQMSPQLIQALVTSGMSQGF